MRPPLRQALRTWHLQQLGRAMHPVGMGSGRILANDRCDHDPWLMQTWLWLQVEEGDDHGPEDAEDSCSRV